MKHLCCTYNFMIKTDWRRTGRFRSDARTALGWQTQILGTVLVKAESTIWKNQKPRQLRTRSTTLKQSTNCLQISTIFSFYHIQPFAKRKAAAPWKSTPTLNSAVQNSWPPNHQATSHRPAFKPMPRVPTDSTHRPCIIFAWWCGAVKQATAFLPRTTLSFDGCSVNILLIKR